MSAEAPGVLRPCVHLIWTPLTSYVTLLPDQRQASWSFLVALAESSEIAQFCFNTGLELIENGDLQASHVRAWAELWHSSSVELVGPEPLSQAVIGCMFYLQSALPSLTETPTPFGGISPGGLSNGGHGQGQDYWGHVFWDQVRTTLLGTSRGHSCHQPIMWQQCKAWSHADTSQEQPNEVDSEFVCGCFMTGTFVMYFVKR